jgi:hypothetical protein
VENLNLDPEADKWSEYFASIRGVCPWSYSAHRKGEIDFHSYSKDYAPFPLEHFQARVVLCPGKKIRWLKKRAEYFMELDPQNEWLYSHPNYPQGAPIPCLIQQDQEHLDSLRKQFQSKDINTM